MTHFRILTPLLCAASLSAQAPAGLTAIRFGTLVDGAGSVRRDAVVVTNADTIVSVGTGAAAVPKGSRVIDLRRYTGIPGNSVDARCVRRDMLNLERILSFARQVRA
jgi:hypothetical protein